MFFKNFFRNDKAKHLIKLPLNDLNKAIDTNRRLLNTIDTWVDMDAFNNSCFEYGVPDFIRIDLDKDIGMDMTYSDCMLTIANKHFDKTKYLEIGVSVGKNFYQMFNGLEDGEVTGFDIEEIYPVIEKRLNFMESDEWITMPGSIKKNRSSFKKFTYKDKPVNYISADVWDENSWSKLQGNKFNLVFSDALHSAEAILFEFEMLTKYSLLDDKFVIVWDDLVGEMETAFYDIIKKYNYKYSIKDKYLLKINGWVGQHEEKHSVGIISNFKI
jgi:hypothetical protein